MTYYNINGMIVRAEYVPALSRTCYTGGAFGKGGAFLGSMGIDHRIIAQIEAGQIAPVQPPAVVAADPVAPAAAALATARQLALLDRLATTGHVPAYDRSRLTKTQASRMIDVALEQTEGAY